jgi:hypothetical protein
MYLARYGSETAETLVAAVRLSPPPGADAESDAWHDALASEARYLLDGTELDFSVRLALRGGRLERVIQLIGPDAAEADIRAVALRLSRLNRLVAGTAALCATREEHDALTGSFPPLRVAVDARPFAAGDASLACDFRLAPHADALLCMAAEQFAALAIQLNVRRHRPSAEALRAVRRNLVRVREEPAIPERLARAQAELAERFESATFVGAEFLGVEEPGLLDGVSAALDACFGRNYGALGYAGAPLEVLSPGAREFEIQAGVHPSALRPGEPFALLAQVWDAAAVLYALAWRPSAGVLERPPANPPPPPERPARVFVSYAHEDAEYCEELVKSLALLRRQRVIEAWTDQDITAGTAWRDEIHRRLEEADIILLLVSTDFIASEFCYDVEMMRAMERHRTGAARVIPILVRSTDLEGAPFMEVQVLPRGAKPVAAWTQKDEAWSQIASSIRRVALEIGARTR